MTLDFLDWAAHPVVRDVVFALVVFVLAVLAFHGVARLVVALGKRLELPPLALRPLRFAARVVIVLVAASALASRFFGLDLLTLLGGILGLVAIGFVAVWSTLSNVLCTLLLLVLRPFRVGDEIELQPEPYKGRVVDLSLFFTTLDCVDGRQLELPNNLFFQRPFYRRRPSPPATEPA